MIGLIYPFLAIAIAGFIVALAVHVAALFAITWEFGYSLKILFSGLVVVWIATILVATRLTRDFKQKDFWRAALRGCPKWMQRAIWIVFGYTWGGFLVLPLLYGGGMNAPANGTRTMSAVLLAFYAVAASVLYSATRFQKFDERRRCLNGHHISPLAKYCDECGAPAQPTSISQT